RRQKLGLCNRDHKLCAVSSRRVNEGESPAYFEAASTEVRSAISWASWASAVLRIRRISQRTTSVSGWPWKFAEHYWPDFEHKPWGCSVTEVQWRAHGFEGSRLAYLLMGAGFFHKAHRAVDDCHALLEILAMPLGTTGRAGRHATDL